MTAPDCRLHAALTASERTDEVEAMARAAERMKSAYDCGGNRWWGAYEALVVAVSAYRARHSRPDAPPALPHRENAGPSALDAGVEGLKPPGCPVPGACACPGDEERLSNLAGQFKRERDDARAALATVRRETEAVTYKTALSLAWHIRRQYEQEAQAKIKSTTTI